MRGGKAEVFGNSGQTINKSTFGDDAQGELMRRANRSSFQLEDCFPMVPEFYRAAKKKLIHNHPGGLLLKRESFAGFAN